MIVKLTRWSKVTGIDMFEEHGNMRVFVNKIKTPSVVTLGKCVFILNVEKMRMIGMNELDEFGMMRLQELIKEYVG